MSPMTFSIFVMVTIICQYLISSSNCARLLELGSELYSRSVTLHSGNDPCHSTSLAGLHVCVWTG